MNGLEQILGQIDAENDAKVRVILDEGKRAADEYLAAEKAEYSSETDVIINKAEKQAAQIVENAAQSRESIIRRAELSEKSDIINGWIDAALKSAKATDRSEYFVIIAKLIALYHHAGEGIIRFSKQDMSDMPDGFIERINKSLKNSSVVLGEPVGIDSGFIISYNGIEENCTFDALLESKTDDIKDALFKLINA